MQPKDPGVKAISFERRALPDFIFAQRAVIRCAQHMVDFDAVVA